MEPVTGEDLERVLRPVWREGDRLLVSSTSISGVLRIRFRVMLAGVALGEGSICFIYVMVGSKVVTGEER